jgi:hypothetical protein
LEKAEKSVKNELKNQKVAITKKCKKLKKR